MIASRGGGVRAAANARMLHRTFVDQRGRPFRRTLVIEMVAGACGDEPKPDRHHGQ